MLRATTSPEGDVNDASGYSPLPGNINQLVLRLGPYLEELHRHGGVISEFVNPKYADEAKSAFKSSTRLECMMQVPGLDLAACSASLAAWSAVPAAS